MATLVCIIETDKIVNGTNLMSGNTNLVKWDSDLSSLYDGLSMFNGCTNLTSFSGNLSSLVNGVALFYGCNLDADSVHNITLTINNNKGVDQEFSRLDLGVNTSILTNTQIKNDFGVIQYKGWTLLFVNGSPNSFETIPWSSQKYNGCTTVDGVKAIDSNYKTTDIIDGKWTEHLCDLLDGSEMFYDYTKLTSFTGDLSSLTNGTKMFRETKLTAFRGDLSSLVDGTEMFEYSDLASFDSDLSSLTNGYYMFYSTQLASFSGDLSNLTSGYSMFYYTPLTSFNGDLSSLADGYLMFANTSITSFNGDLSSLTKGTGMFRDNTSFTSFSGDLRNLTKGNAMFGGCFSLTSFDSNLSSLTNGAAMFLDCKLNTESIKCIANTIKDVTGLIDSSDGSFEIFKQISIGIGNSTPTTEEEGYFNTIASKGWTVVVNGSIYTPTRVASVMTLDENGNEVETTIPYYAKPIASNELNAEYIDADGNYFNIVGGQFIYGDDLSTYGIFTCEEDAAFNMGLTKIDK